MLNNPGIADISGYVNFKAIRNKVLRTNSKLKCADLMPQGLFLESMGIVPRCQALMNHAGANSDEAKRLWSEYERLSDPKQMGEIYKILYFAHDDIYEEVFPFTVKASELYG